MSRFHTVPTLMPMLVLAALVDGSGPGNSPTTSTRMLEPGSAGVDASRIAPYTNMWQMTEVRPGAPERFVGTWEDRVDVVQRNGRPVLRRTQRAEVAGRTSTHLDEVDQRTLQPLRATYESNGVVLSDVTYDGRRLTGHDIATPAGMAGKELIPVGLAVEFPRPVFDWHLWGVLLASFPLQDGFAATFLAHTTSDSEARLLRLFTLRVVGRETVQRQDHARVECYVVRIDAAQPWTFWISTTRRPVPVVQLKIEAEGGLVRWWKPTAPGDSPPTAVN